MNNLEFVQALRSGKHVYGTLIVSTAPKWPGVVAGLGLDFVFIDMEHIALDRTQVSQLCNIYKCLGLNPVVRITSPDPYEASVALDGGAGGVIAPYVETVEQVKQLVGAVKYKPLKGKRLQKLLNKEESVEPELQQYLIKHNSANACIVNIESIPAMEALDEILAVEGIDAVLIGPHDLSCSLGIPEQYDNPEFHDTVEKIIGTARAKNIGAGIHVTYPAGFEIERQWAKKGANLIVHSADIIAFQTTMRTEINEIKKAVSGQNEMQSMQNINI